MSTSSAIAPLRILFFGATGKVGFNVLKKGLLSAKYASKFQVTTPIRGSTLNSTDAVKQDKLTQLRGLGANLIDLDLASASHSALVSAIKGNDILVSATSWSTPPEQSLALLAAAKEAGNLKLFVPSEFGMLYDECSAPFPIGIEGKLKLSAELSASGVPFARILTGVYYEFFFSPFGGYDLAKRTTILPGSADSLITLMSEEDGAQLVAEVLLNYSAVYVRNQTVFLGGDTVSFGSMADLLEQKTGIKWSKSVNTSHELEQYIAQNPNSSFLQCWYLLFARQKAAHWNLQDGNTSFVHLHRKAKPDFQYKLLSVKEYIFDHLKL